MIAMLTSDFWEDVDIAHRGALLSLPARHTVVLEALIELQHYAATVYDRRLHATGQGKGARRNSTVTGDMHISKSGNYS